MLVTPNKSRGDYGPHASFRMAALFAMLCFEFVLFQGIQSIDLVWILCTYEFVFAMLFWQTEVQSAIPNTCYRCDFQGGKKVKACPGQGFNTTGMEVAECSYEKPYCGLTINVTGKPIRDECLLYIVSLKPLYAFIRQYYLLKIVRHRHEQPTSDFCRMLHKTVQQILLSRSGLALRTNQQQLLFSHVPRLLLQSIHVVVETHRQRFRSVAQQSELAFENTLSVRATKSMKHLPPKFVDRRHFSQKWKNNKLTQLYLHTKFEPKRTSQFKESLQSRPSNNEFSECGNDFRHCSSTSIDWSQVIGWRTVELVSFESGETMRSPDRLTVWVVVELLLPVKLVPFGVLLLLIRAVFGLIKRRLSACRTITDWADDWWWSGDS